MKKKVKSKLLFIIFLCVALLPFIKNIQAEDPNIITVGTGGTYTNLIELFKDSNVKGDVVVSLVSDVTNTITTEPLIIPDNYNSLSIYSAEGTNYSLYISHRTSDTRYQAFYANGKKLSISVPMSSASYGGAIYIFGGNFNKDIESASTITINSEIIGYVYGGGFNSNVTGDTTIIMGANSSIHSVYGGGYASNPDNFDTAVSTQAIANVNGNVHIIVDKDASVRDINGGGRALTTNLVANDNIYKATANINGNVTIEIFGKTDEVYGGGEAGHEESEPYTGYEAIADVLGDVSITYGADTAVYQASSMHVYGGGYASSSNAYNGSAQANVTGSTSISILEDALASTKQPSSRAFSRLFGGGMASGNNSVATVFKNTNIHTARPCFESAMGIVGGGWAIRGGTANVDGKASISLYAIEGQKSNYENANGVFGGGVSGGGAPIANPSTANVGSVLITVYPGVQLISGSSYNISLSGGGLAKEGTANVLNDSTIIINGSQEKPVKVQNSLYGSGYADSGATASVLGNSTININHITGSNNIWIKGSGTGSGTVTTNGTRSLLVEGAATASLLWDFSDVKLLNGSSLNLTANSNAPFYSISNVTVEENALLTLNNSGTISEDFIGGGTLAIPNSKMLVIKGVAYNTTNLTVTDPILNRVYVSALNSSSGSFTLEENDLYEMHTYNSGTEFQWYILKRVAPSITISNLKNGRVGANYSIQLTATGSNPIKWSIVGNLPDGLQLNSDTGVISGIPTTEGKYTFTIEADNKMSPKDSKEVTIIIEEEQIPPTITTETLIDGLLGKEYYSELLATGNKTITWEIVSGELPDGLTLDKDSGIISGKPTNPGSYTFTVRATNGIEPDATKQYTILIKDIVKAPTIITTNIHDGVVNKQYVGGFSVLETSSIKWEIIKGSLPTGLTLDSKTGMIQGIPTKKGSYTFTIKAINGALSNATSVVTIVIKEEIKEQAIFPTITIDNLKEGKINTLYNFKISATGNDLTWEVIKGSLPIGLTLDSKTGMIQGIPTKEGTYIFTIQVANIDGQKAIKEFSMQIESNKANQPSIVINDLDDLIVGYDIEKPLVSSENANITFEIVEGSLPKGLELNPQTGAIIGAAQEAGKFDFTIKATDNIGTSVTKKLTLNIDGIKIIKGANSEWAANKEENLEFVANGSYKKFTVVIVDDQEVAKENFTSKEGSTIITFTKEYLQSLSAGKHTLRVNYSDGNYAETNFTINSANQKNCWLWIVLIIVLIIIVILFIYKKRKDLKEQNKINQQKNSSVKRTKK